MHQATRKYFNINNKQKRNKQLIDFVSFSSLIILNINFIIIHFYTLFNFLICRFSLFKYWLNLWSTVLEVVTCQINDLSVTTELVHLLVITSTLNNILKTFIHWPWILVTISIFRFLNDILIKLASTSCLHCAVFMNLFYLRLDSHPAPQV